MKTILRNIFLILVIVIPFMFSGCKKDKNPVPPVISLKSGTPYTPDQSIIAIGHPILFGITGSSSDANITNLVVKKIMPDGTTKVVFDTGMNTPSFSINKTFYQSVEDEAKWTFQVMDKNRQFATTNLTIFKDPNSTYGGIFEFPSITMGYQGSTEFGQFMNPSTGQVFFADSAALRQSEIQVVTYYFVDTDPSPTFSSPGELGGGITTYYPSVSAWTTQNYTKWDISVDTDPIDPVAYENCHNDSLLILSYDDVWGKRKFKWSDPGDIIPFLTASGKKGLIKVITADYDAAGKITFSMKIQQ
jgi:hypothetical protein